MTSLFEKLLAIRKAAPVVKQDGRNTHQNFNYSSSSAVLGALRAAMDEQGVLLVPNVVSREIGSAETKSGTHQIVVYIDIKYTWINVEKPDERLSCGAFTFGVDTDSKAVGKALTYGEKYFLKKFFQIPDNNNDPDQDEPKPYDKPPPQSQKQWTGDSSQLTGKCTENQRKAIWTMAKKLWGTQDEATIKDCLQDIARECDEPFNVSPAVEMDKSSASWLIGQLKGMLKD